MLNQFGRAFTDLDAAGQRAARNQIAAGAALTSVAVGLGSVAAAGIAFMSDATKEAKEFEQGVRLASTQQDKFKNSTKELGDVIKGVAKDIAVPLDALDDGLFDIFSSMDVNLPQAKKLLTEFSKSAVAGATDLQTAGRATIAIMNAWHIPAEDVNRVLDVQFQLVRKGVGTYEEFASTIGRAIPSAQRAGQSVETLAGMLAFLTRNGLSAAMASASAGRAFDAFSNPKTLGRLEKMGIRVKEANGDFRDMGGVILDLQKKMEGLTDPQRASALQDLFKGSGGTIQARRFYDLVLKDAASAEQFIGLVHDMEGAAGEFTKAYDTMASTAENQSQVLANQWEIFKVELGEALLPILKELMKVLQSVFEWWNSLSDGTKKTIMWIGIITVAFTALLAVVLGVAGVWAMLAGAAALLGVSIGALIGIAAAVAAAIIALAAVGYLIWKNWDTIKGALVAAWEWVWERIGPVVIAIRDGIVYAFFWMRDKLVEFWNWLRDKFGDRIINLFNRVRDDVMKAVEAVTGFVREKWDNISSWLTKRWDSIAQFLAPFLKLISGLWDSTWTMMGEQFKAIWDLIVVVFENIIGFIIDTLERAWGIIVGIVKTVWTILSSVISFFIDLIMGMIDIIVGVFTGDWEQAWDGVKRIFSAFIDLACGLWDALWIFIKEVLGNALGWIWDTIKRVFDIVLQVFKSFWDSIVSGFEWAVRNIGVLWDGIMDVAKKPINFVIEYVYNKGIRWVWNKIADFLGLGQLPEAGMIGAVAGASNAGQMSAGRMAKGGVLDGYAPGVDDQLMLLSKGEGVLVPEAVRGLGPAFVHWANAFFSGGRAGRTGGRGGRFADGGIVDSVMGLLGGVGEDVVNIFKNPVEYITNKMGGSQWVRGAAGLMKKGADGVVDKAWNWITSFGGGGGGSSAGVPATSATLQAWIKAAMALAGVPENWFGPLQTLIMRESGGNPNAINLWDINAQNGYPSQGLMQTIPQTFAAYRDPRLPNNIVDPIANIVAGIRYILARYGSIFNVQQAVGSTPMGYDAGGLLQPGLGMYFNGTGVPEHVLTDGQWRAVERAINYTTGGGTYGDGASSSGPGGVNTYNIEMNIYTREIDPRQNALDLGREIGKGV